MKIKGKAYVQPGAKVRFLDPVDGKAKVAMVEGSFKGLIDITCQGKFERVHKKFLRKLK